MENLNSLTVKDLRERLVGLGQSPPSKMKKAELIEMLSSVSGDSDDVSAPAMAAEEPAGGSGEAAQDAGLDIMSLTVPELKQELKQRGLKVGGKKNELQERLSEALAGSMGAGEAESSEAVEAFSETLPESEEAVTEFSETYADGAASEESEDVPLTRAAGEKGEGGKPAAQAEMDSEDAEYAKEWAETTQVFVRGIPFKARPQDLVDLFESDCGIVTRIEGMFFNGRASGRAWVTFEDKQGAEAALTKDREEMDGRFIEVYPPWSRPARQALRQVTEGQGLGGPREEERGMRGGRGGMGGRGGYGERGGGAAGYGRTHTLAAPKCKHLFVGRIPLEAVEDDLHDALQGVEGVVDVRMGFKDGEFRGYAHVEFEHEDAAEEALARPIVIMGRACRADFAAPRRNDSTRTRYR